MNLWRSAYGTRTRPSDDQPDQETEPVPETDRTQGDSNREFEKAMADPVERRRAFAWV